MKNVIVSEFLQNHAKDIKITYVRDVYGFKKGVVVRLFKGKDAKVGWSVVHPNDCTIRFRKPHQLPFYQWMVGTGCKAETIYWDVAFQRLLENGGYVKEPKFDKYEGLSMAINRALTSPITTTDSEITLAKDIPNDEDLINALAEVLIYPAVVKIN